MQVTLGALTVLSRRDIWINSFHVVCGALVLATSLVLTLRSWRVQFATRRGPQAATADVAVAGRAGRPAQRGRHADAGRAREGRRARRRPPLPLPRRRAALGARRPTTSR